MIVSCDIFNSLYFYHDAAPHLSSITSGGNSRKNQLPPLALPRPTSPWHWVTFGTGTSICTGRSPGTSSGFGCWVTYGSASSNGSGTGATLGGACP
jgi:hypothetical protein